jgi:hypothetical protein
MNIQWNCDLNFIISLWVCSICEQMSLSGAVDHNMDNVTTSYDGAMAVMVYYT